MPPEGPAEAEAASARRKACDLCFTKKIKCDMLKPVCSNCILYSSECRTTSVARRKANVARSKQSVKAQLESRVEENEGLRTRLTRIEKQLQQVLESTQSQHANAQASSSSPDEVSPNCSSTKTHGSSWKFDPVEPSLYNGPSDEGLALPPLENIIPVIDHYFNTFNQVLPLFDHKAFMRLLTGWYNHSIKRDRATWAAILMVCAIGLRSPVPGDVVNAESAEKAEWANYCMRNAQSVMSELVTRDEDLLGMQVLIALVLQFHNSSDARPASVLIGTAVRLGHRLRLHSGDSAQYFAPGDVLQRNKVFWIAYMLDKDISLRTQAPASQSDLDIDISLPPLNPSDGSGLIWTKDGRSQFNVFRLRIDLAHIQGKVYDLLYSNRSLKVRGPERERRVASLSAMLTQWYARIPTAFRIEHAAATVGDAELVQLVKMHHAYLHAIVHIHGVYSYQSEWITRVSSLSKTDVHEFGVSMQGPSSVCSTEHQNPPLADGWDYCVEVSRGCMKLFQDATPTECLIWQCSCAYFSGLVILLANIIMSPTHPYVSLDQQISNKAVNLFEDLMEVIKPSPFEKLRRLIGDLRKSATAAVDKARVDQANAGDDVFGDGTSAELDPFEGEIGFPELVDVDGEGLGSMELDGLFDPFVVPAGRGLPTAFGPL